ncbi:hypothetical protein ACM25N_03285 [Roseovarius sp. C7]|uniref:hypothetical protein n=1 Tax=Roseovarius sp. C7 TaxID=3398643 RepID=UPI0039F5FC2C
MSGKWIAIVGAGALAVTLGSVVMTERQAAAQLITPHLPDVPPVSVQDLDKDLARNTPASDSKPGRS